MPGSKPQPLFDVVSSIEIKRKANELVNYQQSVHQRDSNALKVLQKQKAGQNRRYHPIHRTARQEPQPNSFVNKDATFEEEIVEDDVETMGEDYLSKVCDVKQSPYVKLNQMVNVQTEQRYTLRAIPHYENLWKEMLSLMPSYVFRVVHVGSAGKVFKDQDNVTHIWSQAILTNVLDDEYAYAAMSNFAGFSRYEIRDQLKRHINNEKGLRSNRFLSHFISTTDSLAAAITRAERHLCRGDKDVKIYLINTYTLQKPTLSMLMSLAVQAWDVSSHLVEWRYKMFKYDSRPEWIFWDRIVASNVTEIDYLSFSRPLRRDGPLSNRYRPRLGDIIPQVLAAVRRARRIEASRRGVSSKGPSGRSIVSSVASGRKQGDPRRDLHSKLYYSKDEQKILENWCDSVFVGRLGHLPTPPKPVTEDQRSLMDDQTVENVWNTVSEYECHELLFVWLLSLNLKQYCCDNVVDAILRRHPEVVVSNLQVLIEPRAREDKRKEVLVHYVPRSNRSNRVGGEQYHSLMKDVIIKWDREEKKANPLYKAMPVYIVAGEHRPLRNFIQPKECGLQGSCQTQEVLAQEELSCRPLTVDEVETYGSLIEHPESDREYNTRMLNTPFHWPKDIKLLHDQKVPLTLNDRSDPVMTRRELAISFLRSTRRNFICSAQNHKLLNCRKDWRRWWDRKCCGSSRCSR